jgi:hypothetical protein
MIDLTWYILGTLTGVAIYYMYLLSEKLADTWLNWAGLGTGIALILFSIAWGVGAVLEGVPRAGSMGLLLFGFPGLTTLTLTLKRIMSQSRKEIS